MNSSNRIIVNTITQYTKTFINIVLSLYSSRLVLMILGQSDFGIYSLIAGIVALLSFLTNSMVMSTQRFLSISQGKGEEDELKTVFNNSLILHFVIGLLIVLIFFLITPFLFNGFLNIPEDRIDAARIVYFITTVILFTSFQTSPYKALLVSHENIIYTSVIDVIDGVLKLSLVLLLPYSTADMLIVYGFMMLCIQMFNFLAYSIYGHLHYEECVYMNFRRFNIKYAMKLAKFTGWITLSSFCLVGRNQGFAIVINKLLATTANAAYGIANQLSGYLNFLSSSFATSVAPQLMQAVGKSDFNKAISLAKFQSKMGFLLFGLVSIPLMFEVEGVLTLWLKQYPEHTPVFSIMIIASSLIDQPTYGLTTTIQALGKLALYTFVFYGPKFLVLPISWILLSSGYSVVIVAFVYCITEMLCMILRMILLRIELPMFSISNYVKDVIVPISIPTTISVIVCILITGLITSEARPILTFSISGFIYTICSYYYTLNDKERKKTISMLHTLLSKIVRK